MMTNRDGHETKVQRIRENFNYIPLLQSLGTLMEKVKEGKEETEAVDNYKITVVWTQQDYFIHEFTAVVTV